MGIGVHGLIRNIQIVAFQDELDVVVRATFRDDGPEKSDFSDAAGQHLHDAETDDGFSAAGGHGGDIKVV